MHNPSILVICGRLADRKHVDAIEAAAQAFGITPTMIADSDDLVQSVIARHIHDYDAVAFIGNPSVSMEQLHDDHPRLTIVALGPFPADESTIGIYLTNDASAALRHITQESGRRVTADHLLTQRTSRQTSILATV